MPKAASCQPITPEAFLLEVGRHMRRIAAEASEDIAQQPDPDQKRLILKNRFYEFCDACSVELKGVLDQDEYCKPIATGPTVKHFLMLACDGEISNEKAISIVITKVEKPSCDEEQAAVGRDILLLTHKAIVIDDNSTRTMTDGRELCVMLDRIETEIPARWADQWFQGNDDSPRTWVSAWDLHDGRRIAQGLSVQGEPGPLSAFFINATKTAEYSRLETAAAPVSMPCAWRLPGWARGLKKPFDTDEIWMRNPETYRASNGFTQAIIKEYTAVLVGKLSDQLECNMRSFAELQAAANGKDHYENRVLSEIKTFMQNRKTRGIPYDELAKHFDAAGLGLPQNTANGWLLSISAGTPATWSNVLQHHRRPVRAWMVAKMEKLKKHQSLK